MRAPCLVVRTPLELWAVMTAQLLARGGVSAALLLMAEADGNRTRQAGDARLNGFEEVQPASAEVRRDPAYVL